MVRNALATEPIIARKILGVALSKVSLAALPRYGRFGGAEQVLQQYEKYYGETSKQPLAEVS
jgi:hypothetical protein